MPTEDTDVTRRTWLAAERTWLAWWRTGLAAAAVGFAVGRLLPVSHHAHWPFAVLALSFELLAVAILILGATRQRRGAATLKHGGFDELSGGTVTAVTAAAVVLSLITAILVAVDS